MKAEAKANEDADKKVREKAEKLNMVDSLIFQTEKQLKDVGDKIPADKKAALEAALVEVKAAKDGDDDARLDKASEALNAAWQAASQDIYNATQNPAGGPGTGDGQQHAEHTNPGGEQQAENVTDVSYEEVKDDKK